MKLLRRRIELTPTGRILVLGLALYLAVAGLMLKQKRHAGAAPAQPAPRVEAATQRPAPH